MTRMRFLLLGTALYAGSASIVHADGQAFLFLGRSFTGAFLLQDKTTFGGAIGAFSGPFGFEVTADYTPLAGFNVGPIGFGASITNIAGNLVVQIPIGGFAPYGTVGYGAFIANANTGAVPADFLGTFGALNFGLGVKVFASDHVGVRVDYRRFAVQTGDNNPKLAIPLTGIAIDPSPDMNRLTFGASFRF